MNETKRLDSLLADLGFCSRRKVAAFLAHNRVVINNELAKEPGLRVDLVADQLVVNGKKVNLGNGAKEFVYYVVNKPKGILSAVSDNAKRKTVASLVPKKIRVYPVGRLDEQSSGLLLLTNDGDLAHKLTHPRYHIAKTYLVWVVGKPSEKRLDFIRQGMKLQEGWTKPVAVTVLRSSPKRILVEVILHEGKNHQIRRMFTRVGINIVELKRIKMGSVELAHLGLGQYRELSEQEISRLKAEVAAKVAEVEGE